jgi:hypothetical protein
MGSTSGSWTQSTQADFQSDSLANLVTGSSRGVTIAAGGQLSQMGFPAINRTVYCCAFPFTVIETVPGAAAPVSGQIYSYEFYANVAGGQIELKVFRDNSTAYTLVNQGPRVSMFEGYNYYNLASPISVQRGDLLGFYWTGQLSYSPGTLGDEVFVGSTDMNGTSAHSSWFRGTLNYAIQADIRPDVTGTLLSTIRDTSGTSTWNSINWTATVPQGTSLTLNTRTSNDSITWSKWSANYTSSPATIKSSPGRYIQYQAVLSATGNSTETPALQSVALSYNTTPPASSSPSFLSTYLPWIILAAVVVGFAAAVFLTKPKVPKTG